MPVDPRISARRVAVLRAEGRRRLRVVLVASGLVGMAVAGWGLTRTPLLDVDHVRYEGVGPADLTEVEATSGLRTGTGMVDLDLGAVARDLAALPWVATASAEREWPGTVRVVVEPRVAVAVLGTSADPVLVDAEGVLVRPAQPDSDLPRVAVEATVGLGEIQADVLPGIAVAAALPDDLRQWVEAVTMARIDGSDTRVELGLDLIGSAEVILGSGEFIVDKLDAVRAVLERVDLTCLAVIDVVVADTPVTTRDETCEGPTIDGVDDEADDEAGEGTGDGGA